MTTKVCDTSPSTAWSDELADWYSANHGVHPSHEIVVSTCIEHLCNLENKETLTLLDIGCGNGSVVQALASQLQCDRIIGVDPTPRMIEIASEATRNQGLLTQTEYYVSGAECLPVVDHEVDWALAIYSVHHWHDLVTGLTEVKRVLHPAGRFFVVVEERPDLDADCSELAIKEKIEANGFLLEAQATHKTDAYHCYSLLFRLPN